jgi:5S rRNA maturation endonuclease (ribonuclease M5)
MNGLDEIKGEINLIEYARRYDIKVDEEGKANCPFHPPDNNQSFSIFRGKEGVWCWKDFHDGEGGTIVDLVMRLENISLDDALRKLFKEFSDNQPGKQKMKPAPIKRAERKLIREHIYKDATGKPIFKKLRFEPKDWETHHFDGGWKLKKGPHEWIPYNLDRFIKSSSIILCEGERDADSVNALDTGSIATSAPTGKGSWPDSITQYFKGKEITIIYDVGNTMDTEKVAAKLKAAFPAQHVYIAEVPLLKPEQDITDFLNQFDEPEMKRLKFVELVNTRKKFGERAGYFIGSVQEFLKKQIPAEEKFIDPIISRGSLVELGGVKGSHKSFTLIQLCLCASSGHPFFRFPVTKPIRTMFIQQEISECAFRSRLDKIFRSGQFDPNIPFFPFTTTPDQLKFQNDEDLKKIEGWIKQYKPDMACFDPFSSFDSGEENRSKDRKQVVSILNKIKSEFGIAVVISAHHSSKRPADDPFGPQEAAGWIRGHTALTDAADCIINLHRLRGQRDNLALPRSFECYHDVEIDLRNDQRPARFSIEFDPETFLLRESTIWSDIGKKIMPGQIEEFIRDHDGKVTRKELMDHFGQFIGQTTIKTALNECLKLRTITKIEGEGKGKPISYILAKPLFRAVPL